MKKLEHELDALKERVAAMGDLAQSMVTEATAALADPQNEDRYRSVLAQEDRLDQMQLDVDKEAIRLLTVYGPVAGDLRFVLSVSRINAELERIGDQTVSMYGHIRLMASKSDAAALGQFEGMTKLVRTMLYDALKAFRLGDAPRAKATMASDNLVDVLNDEIVREVLGNSPERPDGLSPEDIAGSVALIMISQSLERIADQTCNVCEQIVYMVEGIDVRHQSPDYRPPAKSS
jgi:phosphate transport system protein